MRLHLGKQTSSKLKSLDMLALGSLDADAHLDALLEDKPAGVIFDGASREALRKTAELIWKRRPEACFVIGSSGFTHGLAVYWRATGLVKMANDFSDPGPVDRLIVMASSSSGVTERQIRWALGHGFEGIHIDTAALSDGKSAEAAKAALLKPALRHLKAGKSVVLHRAPGPAGGRDTAHREELGAQMGKLLRDLLARSGVKRAVIVGANAASHAARELGVYALTMLAPIAPGAPLCRAHSEDAGSRGLELAFKGGHIGPKDFFGAVRAGKSG